MTKKQANFLPILLLAVAYLISRMVFLTRMPVFADEAIYIRWAQLSVNQPDEYKFLSMLDGKPPLHNWLIIPMLEIFKDPLFAARMLSVLAGGITLVFLYKLSILLTKDRKFAQLAVLLSILLPFWITNHRLALAESLLALFFTSGLFYAFKNKTKAHTLLFGISWGLALWTKTNAIFFTPVFAAIPLMKYFTGKKDRKLMISRLVKLLIGGILGGLIFLLLRKVEIFPSLFSRSQDYTFTLTELIQGEWRHVVGFTMPTLIKWFGWYLTPSAIILMFYERKKNLWLFLLAFLYIAPIAAMGRILSPRYFFPVVPIFTLMIVNGIQKAQKNKRDKMLSRIFLAISLFMSVVFSYKYIVIPDSTPFVERDRVQYLQDWSSGHGIPQVRDFVAERIKDHKVSVATEGYFGTLPDGLLMYFDKSPDIVNLEIYGIGQPIVAIGSDLREKSKEREVYIVVNSHRFSAPMDPQIQKIGEYKRPGDAPSLLLLKINPLDD